MNLSEFSEINDIFTSEDEKNAPPKFRVWFRLNFTSGILSSRTLASLK